MDTGTTIIAIIAAFGLGFCVNFWLTEWLKRRDIQQIIRDLKERERIQGYKSYNMADAYDSVSRDESKRKGLL